MHYHMRNHTSGNARALRTLQHPHPDATGRGHNASRTDALEDAEVVDRQVAGGAAAARIQELELHVAAGR